MNQQDQEIFNSIVLKNPEDLNSFEKDFLKARRTYLNNEQRRIFESVLLEKQEEEPRLYVSKKDREAQEKAK